MNKFKRIFIIVIDSLGIGAMPNAKTYGDEGCDTLGHIDEHMNPFEINTLMRLGIDKIHPILHAKKQQTIGYQARMFEASNGKDTLTGHLEMMGIYSNLAPLTFTEKGFPQELIQELERQTGHQFIGNIASSGTEILKKLASHETKSNGKKLILYTSADSVLQICGNEKITGLDELYRCCEIARQITMAPDWKVARIIARPYIIQNDQYIRTPNRKDYALSPPNRTCLDLLKEHQLDVIGIGKISDIFNHQGITESYHSTSSLHGMDQTIAQTKKDFHGVCFTNLVDFDAKWGHRRDVIGYGKELESFDKKLKKLIPCLMDTDLLMITADHGNDPCAQGSDHTKEIVPLLLYSPRFKKSETLPDQVNFGTVGATILENFNILPDEHLIGTSILTKLI